MKTVLVTGGAGFVGSHLCKRLHEDGYRVISLDNYFTGSRENHVPGVEYREGHTKDIETLVPETPDLVFHLGEYARAEKSFEDMEQLWDLNKTGTFAVLEFVRRRGSKIVYAGSSTKFSDGGAGRDQSPYAWTKATNTELVRNYAAWFGIPYAITYFYNVYGPGERAGAYGTVIEIFKQNYRSGRPLPVVLPGTQMRNFTHVSDIVDGLVLVGEKGEGDGYELGNERSYSIQEVADLFKAPIVHFPERPGNRLQSALDTARARELGWRTTHDLETYIREFLAATTPLPAAEERVLVFTTTFHPISGPAEEALCELMRQMPDIHFDIVTTRYAKDSAGDSCPVENATVHRVGIGSPIDKYLLPFYGARTARMLMREHRYLFMWSIMASYGALAGIRARRNSSVPLLVTLADQSLSPRVRFFLRLVMRSADQVFATLPEQERRLPPLRTRMRGQRSLGAGDAFANPMRFAYATILRRQTRP